MRLDRDGRRPEPKALGLCTEGNRLVATHREGVRFWRHAGECSCPDYSPWADMTITERTRSVLSLGRVRFKNLALADEFRTAALELLTGFQGTVSDRLERVRATERARADESILSTRTVADEMVERAKERAKACSDKAITDAKESANRWATDRIASADSRANARAASTVADAVSRANARAADADSQIADARLHSADADSRAANADSRARKIAQKDVQNALAAAKSREDAAGRSVREEMRNKITAAAAEAEKILKGVRNAKEDLRRYAVLEKEFDLRIRTKAKELNDLRAQSSRR